jgi:hypothetical protein
MAMRVFIRCGPQVILNDIEARQLSVTKARGAAGGAATLSRPLNLSRKREREMDGP